MAKFSADVKLTEGDYVWNVPSVDEPVRTHYWIHQPSSTSHQIPLIILHGGPGVPSIYMSTHAQLATRFGVPVIFYDQLGCGKSTRIPSKMGDTKFWSVDLFLQELKGLVAHLRLDQAQFDILGHSWGAMLAASYAITHPTGLRKLVLASGLARMKDWMNEAMRLRKTLPAEVQEVLDRCEREGKEDSDEYEAAVGQYYGRYLCRMDPMPKDLADAFGELGKDPTVYFTMFGKNEFSCTGVTKDFDIVPSLHKINVPTLITHGRYDEATDLVVRPFFEYIPQVKWVQYSDSAHMSHIEEAGRYMEVLGGFLKF